MLKINRGFMDYLHGQHHGAAGHGGEDYDSEKLLRSAGLDKGMVAVDMGCGPGFFTIPIASIVGPEGKVYAVDTDAEALDSLKAEMEKKNISSSAIVVMQASMLHTAIPDHSVDVIFLANVLHGIFSNKDNKLAFFKEAKRISKPDAMLVDIDWDKTDTVRGPPVSMRIPMEDAKAMLSENGFKFAKSIEAGQSHYGIICKLASS